MLMMFRRVSTKLDSSSGCDRSWLEQMQQMKTGTHSKPQAIKIENFSNYDWQPHLGWAQVPKPRCHYTPRKLAS